MSSGTDSIALTRPSNARTAQARASSCSWTDPCYDCRDTAPEYRAAFHLGSVRQALAQVLDQLDEDLSLGATGVTV